MTPPINIDGTQITGATIDGSDVSAITVDGTEVFSIQNIIEDFEDGNVNGWNFVTSVGGSFSISSDTIAGAFAGNLSVTNKGDGCVAYFDSFGRVDFTNSFRLRTLIKDNNETSETNQGIGYLYNETNDKSAFITTIGNRGGDPTFEIMDRSTDTIVASANPAISRGKYFELIFEHDGSGTFTATLNETNGTNISQISATHSQRTSASNAFIALRRKAKDGENHSTNYDNISFS